VNQIDLFFLTFSDVPMAVIVQNPVNHIRVLSILFVRLHLMWLCHDIGAIALAALPPITTTAFCRVLYVILSTWTFLIERGVGAFRTQHTPKIFAIKITMRRRSWKSI